MVVDLWASDDTTFLIRSRYDDRHGSTEDHATSSLSRRRNHRSRPRQADGRTDAASAVTRAGRPPGAGVPRSDPDTGAIPRRRVGVRSTDGTALLAAQHAGLSPHRAH